MESASRSASNAATVKVAEIGAPRTAESPAARTLTNLGAWVCLVLSSISLIGWAFSVPILMACLVPGGNPVKVSTAFGQLFVAVALLPWTVKAGRGWAATMCGAGVLLISGTSLMGYFIAAATDGRLMSWWLLESTISHPMRMSFNTALSLTMIGSSLIGRDGPSEFFAWFRQLLALCGAVLGYVALLGHLYDAEELYQFSYNVNMSLPSALAILLGGLGCVVREPRRALASAVTSEAWGGRLLRRLMPIGGAAWPMAGLVRLWAQRHGYVDLELGLAMYTGAGVLMMGAALWFAARSLNDADQRRRASEDALRISNETLEARVRARTHDLERSEAHFRLLAEAAPALIWVTDASMVCTYMNRVCTEFLGVLQSDPGGFSWNQHMHPEDALSLRQSTELSLRTRGEHTLRFRLRRHDGEYRWVQGRAAPRLGADGSLAGFVGACVDVTEIELAREQLREALATQEEALAREKTLRRELDHRVRNNLAGLMGLVSLYQRGGRGAEHFAEGVKGKIRAMKDVHDIIARAGGRQVQLRDLLRSLTEALNPGWAENRFALLGDSIPIAPEQASALAMIVQELATNSFKHGALGGESGRVRVEWKYEDSSGARMLTLEWRETGGLLSSHAAWKADDVREGGVGLHLIEGFARSDLRGGCRFVRAENSWTCQLTAHLGDTPMEASPRPLPRPAGVH